MKQNTEAARLKIPENLPLRGELFRGFGWSETARTALVVAFAAVGAWIYTLLSNSPLRALTALVIVLAAGGIAVGIFTKQRNNLSIYDYIKYAVQFGKSQKQYDFVRLEECFLELPEERKEQ